MWKKRLGSGATYRELVQIFRMCGDHATAEIVQNIACNVEGETQYPSNIDSEESVCQRPTYPHLKQSPPPTPKPSTHMLSLCDEYVLVCKDAAQNLREGIGEMATIDHSPMSLLLFY